MEIGVYQDTGISLDLYHHTVNDTAGSFLVATKEVSTSVPLLDGTVLHAFYNGTDDDLSAGEGDIYVLVLPSPAS